MQGYFGAFGVFLIASVYYNAKKARLIDFSTYTIYFNIENLHFCMNLAGFACLSTF